MQGRTLSWSLWAECSPSCQHLDVELWRRHVSDALGPSSYSALLQQPRETSQNLRRWADRRTGSAVAAEAPGT